jgi:hypothetical protein
VRSKVFQWPFLGFFFTKFICVKCRPGSSVCIAADYGLDGPGSNAGRE